MSSLRTATAVVIAGAALFAAATCSPGGSDSLVGGGAGVQWIDGWSKGRKAAESKGRPMLVYVGRKSPT